MDFIGRMSETGSRKSVSIREEMNTAFTSNDDDENCGNTDSDCDHSTNTNTNTNRKSVTKSVLSTLFGSSVSSNDTVTESDGGMSLDQIINDLQVIMTAGIFYVVYTRMLQNHIYSPYSD